MRILVIRYGAWGDSVIITPLLRHLKSLGNEVYLHTSETGGKILKGNPNVDKFIPYVSDSVPDGKLQEFWADLAKEHGCDKTINLCESIERALSFHPCDPIYAYTKKERSERGDKNFYEYTFVHAAAQVPEMLDGGAPSDYLPEMFFTEEEAWVFRAGQKSLLGLMGSFGLWTE
jgi:ADP-heptose:LPS heptosyltransferase